MDAPALTETVELKPAPEPLLAVQALIDTRVILRGEERFGDRAAASSWLRWTGLLAPGPDISREELDELIALREALRRALEARDGLDTPDGNGLAELWAIAERHPVRVGFGADGPAVDLAPAADVASLISQLLAITLSASVRDEWQRLKICANPDCRWAFYDRAKNRTGTWCSMDVCGNRAKVRAHRERGGR